MNEPSVVPTSKPRVAGYIEPDTKDKLDALTSKISVSEAIQQALADWVDPNILPVPLNGEEIAQIQDLAVKNRRTVEQQAAALIAWALQQTSADDSG